MSKEKDTLIPLIVTMGMVLVVGLVWLLLMMVGSFDADPTCPNYGEVPALIEGGYECIPWEVQP